MWIVLYKLGALIGIIGGVLSLPGLALCDCADVISEYAQKQITKKRVKGNRT